ncbi:hypothetical protein Ppa06_48370 [Planomonospora parontospora subsp. parontospora]|uniref:Uncharacterized protein n=2 Tax=Planomonospora parontospora TaxID=58119 RepID=A0AA37BJN8_9ACTN|nr:hypothetical protein [Planomonospora parontospora]GGK81668.1 hypothetical protein GCM10010126_46230 [Planomonospora parontospora]GII11039.1 hypothetical protein Ppa06_48370 [Planomonospora parontospora subsp. parontospora]
MFLPWNPASWFLGREVRRIDAGTLEAPVQADRRERTRGAARTVSTDDGRVAHAAAVLVIQ